MEKKRRINLKRKFDLLRQELTSLGHSDKAPKVQILNEAIRECQELKAKENELILEKQAVLIAQEALKSKINALQGKLYC